MPSLIRPEREAVAARSCVSSSPDQSSQRENKLSVRGAVRVCVCVCVCVCVWCCVCVALAPSVADRHAYSQSADITLRTIEAIYLNILTKSLEMFEVIHQINIKETEMGK